MGAFRQCRLALFPRHGLFRRSSWWRSHQESINLLVKRQHQQTSIVLLQAHRCKVLSQEAIHITSFAIRAAIGIRGGKQEHMGSTPS